MNTFDWSEIIYGELKSLLRSAFFEASKGWSGEGDTVSMEIKSVPDGSGYCGLLVKAKLTATEPIHPEILAGVRESLESMLRHPSSDRREYAAWRLDVLDRENLDAWDFRGIRLELSILDGEKTRAVEIVELDSQGEGATGRVPATSRCYFVPLTLATNIIEFPFFGSGQIKLAAKAGDGDYADLPKPTEVVLRGGGAISCWFEPGNENTVVIKFRSAAPQMNGGRVVVWFTLLGDPDMKLDPYEARDSRGVVPVASVNLETPAATPLTLAQLFELLSHENEWDVRSNAADALGQMGPVAATPTTLVRLVELTRDDEERVRWSAAQALGQMGAAAATQETLTRLMELSHDDNWNVRSISAQALGKMGRAAATPDALTRLVKLTWDDEERVRRSAAHALWSVERTEWGLQSSAGLVELGETILIDAAETSSSPGKVFTGNVRVSRDALKSAGKIRIEVEEEVSSEQPTAAAALRSPSPITLKMPRPGLPFTCDFQASEVSEDRCALEIRFRHRGNVSSEAALPRFALRQGATFYYPAEQHGTETVFRFQRIPSGEYSLHLEPMRPVVSEEIITVKCAPVTVPQSRRRNYQPEGLGIWATMSADDRDDAYLTVFTDQTSLKNHHVTFEFVDLCSGEIKLDQEEDGIFRAVDKEPGWIVAEIWRSSTVVLDKSYTDLENRIPNFGIK